MGQATLDNDDLFGEAASEMRADVESSLEASREELPAAADIWDIDGENTLGTLNTLKSELETGEARDHLRDAKKWFTMGQRADAFDDAADLEAEIEDLEETITTIEEAAEQVADLTTTIPALRSSLTAPDEDADEE